MAHWSEVRERGAGSLRLALMVWCYRRLGMARLRRLIHPLVWGMWLGAPALRRVSRRYLALVAAKAGLPRPRALDSYRHVYSFACSLLEKLAAWTGGIALADLAVKTEGVGDLIAELRRGQGAVVVCSHLGNVEVLRALASLEVERGQAIPRFAVNSIVEFGGSAQFNRMLAKANPDSTLRLVPASDMGADTIIALKDRLNQGELVIIAGDRTAAANRGKTERVPFLGRTAYFPQGAFVLASLLEAPVYFMFGVRGDDFDAASPYGFYVWRAGVELRGSRRERMAKIRLLVEEYVGHLEGLCLEHPYQWYNFFDFWKNPAPAGNGESAS